MTRGIVKKCPFLYYLLGTKIRLSFLGGGEMFLKTVKAKGNTYLYLCSYDPIKKVRVIYGFGMRDKAIQNMKEWLKHFHLFPLELINIGCSRKDLMNWIKKLDKQKEVS